MLISLKQLNKYLPKIQLDQSIEKVINKLGYEVESITPFSDVKGIKFGKVLSVQKNENSKNLNIVTLETNIGKIQIQTVATNAKVGYWTVAFVEGAQKGDIVFTSKKMAGVLSQGMLSGYSELCFNPDLLPYHPDDLIMIKSNAKKPIDLDTDPIKYFELDDYIIDITTPSNRADINSYYVLALELSAYYKTEFKWLNWDIKNLKPKFKSKLRINKNLANALSFLEVKTNDINTNLDDMLFLAKHNVSVKNNWAIDMTNINLIMTGCPTHAYDKTKIKNDISCNLYSGKLEILGNKEVEVENVLTINDNEGPISIASVMGLTKTEVEANTKEVAFEIGSFDIKKIRQASKQIKILSNSAIQGSKGINNELIKMGMQFLVFKAKEYKHSFSNIVNLPASTKANTIIQNRHKLATYANLTIGELSKFIEVEQQLKNIGFKMDKNKVTAPKYRSDITLYEDVIEEYFRFYGYDNFLPEAPKLLTTKVKPKKTIKNYFQKMGYQEVRTFTLIAESRNIFNPFNFEKSVKLSTFVSFEREVVRNSIIPSLLEIAEYNLKRKLTNFSFFEKGMINENNYVYGIISTIKSFDEIKNDIAKILKTTNLEFKPFSDNEYVHPNASAKIYYENKFIGWIGKVHPYYANKVDAFVAEFMDINNETKIVYQEYDQNPLKTLDITFTLELNQSIDKVISEIKQNAKIYDIKLIDTYVNNNQKNVTFRIFGDNDNIEKLNQKYNK
ncbi:phenylalanine--tRNA ligase subunit beta [Mycoplasmopsis gallinarum]